MFNSSNHEPGSKIEKKLMQAIQKMKDQYAGIGKNGFLAKLSEKVVKKSIIEASPSAILSKVTFEQQSNDSPSRLMSREERRKSFKKIRKQSVMKTNFITNPYSDIKYSPGSTSSSSEEEKITDKCDKKRSLYFDIDAYKNPYTLMTDKQIVKMNKRMEVRKSVHREIKKVETMFPVSLLSRKSIYQSKNQSIEEMKGSVMNNFVKKSKFNHNLLEIPRFLHQKPLLKNHSVLNEQLNDSIISEDSVSEYKKMPEKQIIFKILDKHAQANANKKKRQAYMQKKAFVKGIFNDHSLHWDMRNNSTRAQNYVGVSVLRNTYDDDVRGQGSHIPQSNRKARITLQSSKSVNALMPTIIDEKSECTPSNATTRRQKSSQLFHSINQKANGLIENCIKTRKDLRIDKQKFFSNEEQLQKFINIQRNQEQRINKEKQSIEEAESFAKIVSRNKEDLRKKIFNTALQEFRDNEYMDFRSREIEAYLCQDYLSNKQR